VFFTVGTPVAFLLESDGNPQPTFVLAPGSAMPDGLELDNSGIITGTPTMAGDTPFQVVLMNSVGSSDPLTITAHIAANTSPPVTPPPAAATMITSGSVTGTVGTPLSFQLTADGAQPQIFNAEPEFLFPNGLSMSSSGLITGTPTAVASNQEVTVVVNNAGGSSPTLAVVFQIAAAAPVPPPATVTFQLIDRIGSLQTVAADGAETGQFGPVRFFNLHTADLWTQSDGTLSYLEAANALTVTNVSASPAATISTTGPAHNAISAEVVRFGAFVADSESHAVLELDYPTGYTGTVDVTITYPTDSTITSTATTVIPITVA
jgi:hypothetical protein